eukprot:gnl/TRDRNA2_/TRDRNA2_29911_c0_seq1.p1 gnl/TRDRNA2_/TRDRNA2_29911_c0~~gnl/TRDRNA2_/TRDRNA2_29911_c0_seq1.p1  ORF type:complete len:350 (+),score=71.87 gnl/TRDRNA2_/TRDRNA2_29911_c0_seq1:21-1070(+)
MSHQVGMLAQPPVQRSPRAAPQPCAFTFPEGHTFNQQLRAAALLSLQRKEQVPQSSFTARSPRVRGIDDIQVKKAMKPQIMPLSAREFGDPLTVTEPSRRKDISVTDSIRENLKIVGRKAPQVFSQSRHAFRFVDGNDNGYVNRTEIRYFFRLFNIGIAAADQVFDSLDHNSSGDIFYDDFVTLLWPYVVPDVPMPTCRQPVVPLEGSVRNNPLKLATQADFERVARLNEAAFPDSLGLQDVGDRSTTTQHAHAINKELQVMCQNIGYRLNLQFGIKLQMKLRHAFRLLDLEGNGSCTRSEVRNFCGSFGWKEPSADRLFDLLSGDGEGEVSTKRITDIFIEAAIAEMC